MKRYGFLTKLFLFLGLILSHVACGDIAYSYSSMLCAIRHGGASAPADIVLFKLIPYGIGIAACVVLSLVFKNKTKKSKE